MTLDLDRQNEIDHIWMDSLLHEAFHHEPHREQERLNNLFAKAAFAEQGYSSTVDRRIVTLLRWLPIALAASIVILLGSWSLFPTSSQRAQAAIARGLRPTPVAREYAIRIVAHSLSGSEVTKQAQLFLDSGNRYVVHRRGWLGLGDIWFGTDGSNHWVVPRLGPAIIGSERILRGWMDKKDSTAPYLHIQTILKRMEKGYTLQMLPEMILDGADDQVLCERVRGEWNKRMKPQNNIAFPVAIELWADKVTGIAHRVVLDWYREPNQFGPIQWTIELRGHPSLSEDWFEPAGHVAPGQRIVTIGKESELDAFSKSSEEP